MRILARITISLALVSCLWGQSPRQIFHAQNIPTGGGGGGTIAFVTGQKVGAQSASTNTFPNLAFPGNVTNGDSIIVAMSCFEVGITPTINTPTKSSGTATISAFTQDNSGLGVGASGQTLLRIYRASVTGTGSLTIAATVNNTLACGGSASEYSGLTAVDVAPTRNTGTSATESTGGVTTSQGGMVFMVSSEESTGDFTYTQSDTSIAAFSTGSTQYTFESQHKITGASGTFTLTAGTGNSWFWTALAVAYK